MARVTGVGGVFLRSADPERLARWYAEHLGMTVGADKSCVLMWTDEQPVGTGMTVWSVFPEDTTYFGTGPQPAMVNYRVDDLDSLLAQLGANGVWIDPKQQDDAYGRFAWVQDCDGNRLELWQPLA